MGAVGPEILLLAAAAMVRRCVVRRLGRLLCVVVRLAGTHKSTFDV